MSAWLTTRDWEIVPIIVLTKLDGVTWILTQPIAQTMSHHKKFSTFHDFILDFLRLIPNLSSCWFIQIVTVCSSVSIARSTPILAISSSYLDFCRFFLIANNSKKLKSHKSQEMWKIMTFFLSNCCEGSSNLPRMTVFW